MKSFSRYHLGLFFVSTLTSITSINTLWVPTQGWYWEWAQRASEGVIYKDFYLPLPPLFVEVNRIFFQFSDPLLIERVFMVVIYALVALGLFELLRIYFKNVTSFNVTLITIVLFQAIPTNTIAGYYEFALALILGGTVLTHKELKLLQAMGGVLISCASLTKQNFVPFGILMILYGIWLWVRKKVLYWPSVGVAAVYFIFSAVLTYEKTFFTFVEIMLQGGGKNPNLKSFLLNGLYPFSNSHVLYSSFLVIFLSFILVKIEKFYNDKKLMLLITVSNTLIASELLGLRELIAFPWQYLIILFLIVFHALIYIIQNKEIGAETHYKVLIIVISTLPAACFLLFEILFRVVPYQAKNMIEIFGKISDTSFLSVDNILTLLGITGLVALFFDQKFERVRFQNRNFIIFVCSISASSVLNVFNGGFAYIVSFSLLSFGLAYIWEKFFRIENFMSINGTGFLILVLLSSSITFNTYSWIGWTEKNNIHVFKNLPKPDLFRNFYLTQTELNYYNEVQRGIQLAERNFSDDYSPEIVSWPSQPILMGLSKVQHYKTNCVVLHFDVCPENEAKKDFMKVLTHPPAIVVYVDQGERFLQTEELLWRGRQISSQRLIREYLLNENIYKVISKIPATTIISGTTYILIRA